MTSEIGTVTRFYTARGLVKYRVRVSHSGLGQHAEIKGDDPHLVWAKASGKARAWNERWEKKTAVESKRRERLQIARDRDESKRLAEERTEEAMSAWSELDRVLEATLSVDDAVDWEQLKDYSTFAESRPQPPRKPQAPEEPEPAREPLRSDPDYADNRSLLATIADLFAPGRRTTRVEAADASFAEDHAAWVENERRRLSVYESNVEALRQQYEDAVARYQADLAGWKERRSQHIAAQEARNAAVDADREAYSRGERQAVIDYCDIVLGNSEYPEWNPKSWRSDYDVESKILIVEYDLPSLQALPTLKQVKYVQSRDEMVESSYSDAQVQRAYDSVVYQIALRTIHELFEADVANTLAGVAFNGRVRSIDPGTGHEVEACIVSLQVERQEFLGINLAGVDPKACFRKLKGVGSSKLHSLTPIPPIIQIQEDDDRFVDGYEVAATLDEGENLAAMDWEDFEHLVREVFEREFAGSGGNVKVTRASRDGGIDAVAFDPDPIRGGKIAIQAKRYTRTVGVAAVRELYGTVVNEGANKGVLVTTAAFGPDAYAFVRDKPLTLIDGGRLLHLLQKHGHKVRIDLKAARNVGT